MIVTHLIFVELINEHFDAVGGTEHFGGYYAEMQNQQKSGEARASKGMREANTNYTRRKILSYKLPSMTKKLEIIGIDSQVLDFLRRPRSYRFSRRLEWKTNPGKNRKDDGR